MIALHHLAYTYPQQGAPAVGPLTASVAGGTRLLVTGASGSGKTTLVRLLAGQLQRHGVGTVAGEVRVDGRDPATCSPAERVRLLGLVGQEPGDQLVSGSVADELGFALASACWSEAAIAERVREVAELIGLPERMADDPRQLSGGQQARVVTGAAVAGRPPVLILDEPLAQLDSDAVASLLAVLDALAAAGAVVVMVEHRLGTALPWADRVWVLEQGTLVSDAAADAVSVAQLESVGLVAPEGLRLRDALADAGVRLPELDRWGRCSASVPPGGPTSSAPAGGEVLVALDALTLCRGEREVLRDVSLCVHRGERVAVLGANGTGKSTLLTALARNPEAQRHGRVLGVPQDPDLSLYCESVVAELGEGTRLRGLPWEEVASALATRLGLVEVQSRSPHALSRGQRLRLAIGAALSVAPDVLLLDEPTSGQDTHSVAQVLEALAASATTLVFATHDVETALRFSTRVLVLHEGMVVADGAPHELLGAIASTPGLELPPTAHLCASRGWPLLTLAQVVDEVCR